ncbi:unnamed protein product [Pedinophyceae sp. YPF-701]|nr:unnamed protein product [Pedinophyceae sp. YPF-701]
MSALRIATQWPDAKVALVSDRWGEDTTSYHSGGFWEPYTLADTPDDLVNRWAGDAYKHLEHLAYAEDAARTGVFAIGVRQLWSAPGRDTPPPTWCNIPPDFRVLSADEARRLRPERGPSPPGTRAPPIAGAYTFSSYVADMSRLMPFLERTCEAAGVSLHRGVAVRDCDDMQRVALECVGEGGRGDDVVVVNCAGIRGGSLAGNGGDRTVYPVRGQVVRVQAPQVKHVWFHDEETYIIPQVDSVVLGGSRQVGDWEEGNREEDVRAIREKCEALLPVLRGAPEVRAWAGLRPARPSVRVEREVIETDRGALRVVHNYGHGGAGVTLAWGCAGDVMRHISALLAP